MPRGQRRPCEGRPRSASSPRLSGESGRPDVEGEGHESGVGIGGDRHLMQSAIPSLVRSRSRASWPRTPPWSSGDQQRRPGRCGRSMKLPRPQHRHYPVCLRPSKCWITGTAGAIGGNATDDNDALPGRAGAPLISSPPAPAARRGQLQPMRAPAVPQAITIGQERRGRRDAAAVMLASSKKWLQATPATKIRTTRRVCQGASSARRSLTSGAGIGRSFLPPQKAR